MRACHAGRVIASAPGKLIVAGEYAVLDGAAAVVIAVDRRAVARRVAGATPSSPFLAAIAERTGVADIVVDSAAFYADGRKLGFGSSAAVTVAAAALARGDAGDRDAIFELADAAHARAQGVRGSGADLAAAIHGGVIAFTRAPLARGGRPAIEPLAWPPELVLLAFDAGAPAGTADLIARVTAARAAAPVAVSAALTAIADAAHELRDALACPDPGAAIAAIARGGEAMDLLAAATGLPLVPRCVSAARPAIERLGGALKTTGAGGGDVGIAVVPATLEITRARAALLEAGCAPLAVAIDPTGVDTRPRAQ